MERLPDQIVDDILLRLPVKSIMNCRCVCKSWLQLTNHPFFIKLHLNRTLSLQQPYSNFIISFSSIKYLGLSSPLFNIEYNETLSNYTCNVVGFSESQPNFDGLRVLGSCNGLICLVGFDDYKLGRIYISNPFTRYCVKLPDSFNYNYSGETAVGFGCISEKNQYKVVTIRNFHEKGLKWGVVCVYTLGDVSWRFLEIIPHAVAWHIFPKQVFVNGALHWLSDYGEKLLIAFNIDNETFQYMHQPNARFCDPPSLGVLDGCLSLTGFSFPVNHAEIWVMKEYGVHESWNKYYNVDFTSIGWNNRGLIQTICLGKDGELLMLYRLSDLVSFNVETLVLRMITFEDVQFPVTFEMVSHVSTLVSPLYLEG